jgi:nucleoside-diphosphate-sugar epimerase
MMRILVTGATGGLGRNAVKMLIGNGVAVRATGRNINAGKALAEMGAEFLKLDLALAKPEQVAELVRGMDAIWHCAALSSPWGAFSDFFAANVTVTQRLIDEAIKCRVPHFVHISTPAIYFDYTNHFDVAESFQPRKYVNAYAHTKALAEEVVRCAVPRSPTTRFVILRPRAIFGPHDNVLIPRLVRVLSERHGKLPLPRGGEVTIDVTYVDNVVHAMWLATTKKDLQSGMIFNITNHEPGFLKDILHSLFNDALQRPFRIVALPYMVLAGVASGMQFLSMMTKKEPPLTPYSVGAISYDMTLDNSSAKAQLGYFPPVSLAEGILRTAEWMRDHG